MRTIRFVALAIVLAGCATSNPNAGSGSTSETPTPLILAPQSFAWLEINATEFSAGRISGWLHVTNPTSAALSIHPLRSGGCGVLDVIVQHVESGTALFSDDFDLAYDCAILPTTDDMLVALPPGPSAVPFHVQGRYTGIHSGDHYAVTLTHRPALHDSSAVTVPLWTTVVGATAIIEAPHDIPWHIVMG